jgi:hypothetical protein
LIPFKARDADATETFARRATSARVGATSVSMIFVKRPVKDY